MSQPVILALLWLVATNVIGMVPSRHRHWPQAYALIAVGLPILVAVFVVDGVIVGLIVLLMAASVLRWPVRFFLRWLASLIRRGEGETS